VIPSIVLESGERIPSQPAKTPATRPSQPIQRATTRVRRIATAYSGTTTAQISTSPA
jgi:hypothetical protein